MKRITLLTVSLLALTPFAGHAQTAPAKPGESSALAEVVVTAQRRKENLQEVPISITAFSGEQLEKTNVRGAVDYLAQTPNVSYTEDKQSGARGLAVAIRGVNDLVSGENAFVNSVGVYLDEFSIASVPNGVSNPFMPDMERVEVLRGPQGTYFGRNSLGGALNLTTRDPTDKYEGQVTVGGNSYSSYGNAENITAVINTPLSDTFKIRTIATYEDSTGFVRNVGPGDGAGWKWLNLRSRALWTPSDDTRVSFTVLFGKEHQGADDTVPSGVLDLDTTDTFSGSYQGAPYNNVSRAISPGTGFFPTNQSQYSADLQQRNDDKTTIAIVNVAQKLSSDLTWKTVAGIIKTDQERFFDNDLIGNLDLLSRTNLYTGKSYSLESRIESRTKGMNWVVGAMYAKDDQEQLNDVAVSGNPTALSTVSGQQVGWLPPFPTGLGLALNTKAFKVESYAAFADGTWNLGELTEVFAGARYTHDTVEKSQTQDGLAPGLNPDPTCAGFFGCFGNFVRPVADGSQSYSNVTPRIGIRYKFADSASVYATISEGYKAGGLSTGNNTNLPGSPAIVLPYNKETLWNYEAGIKSELADHRVRLNFSVFYMKWKDLQYEAFRFLTPGDLSSNFEQTINIPSAEAKGVEFELTARATDRLTLGGSLGYLDTQILENQACTPNAADKNCIGGHTFTQITGGFMVNLVGLQIPNAPKVTANAFAEYRWPVAANSAWLRAEYQHRDSIYTDIEAATNQQTLGPSPNSGVSRYVPADQFPYLVPAFDVINVRGGFDWQKASFSLYVQNLTDEKYYSGVYQKFGLSGMRLRPNPRIIGGNVAFRF